MHYASRNTLTLIAAIHCVYLKYNIKNVSGKYSELILILCMLILSVVDHTLIKERKGIELPLYIKCYFMTQACKVVKRGNLGWCKGTIFKAKRIPKMGCAAPRLCSFRQQKVSKKKPTYRPNRNLCNHKIHVVSDIRLLVFDSGEH